VIENHIDNQYDELTCLKITQGRADNIRDQLIARGVEANRIEAVGFGNLNPIFYVKNNILASKNVLVKIKEYE
jgi:outer membrane protein OmpA-like peptidoglycan-associated protein